MHFQSQLATAARRTLGVPSSSSRRPGAARRVHPPAPACLASPAPGPPASRPVCASHDHLCTFSSPEHSDFPNILQKNIFVELQTIFESTKQYFYPLLHILPTSSQAEQGLANARAARAGTASARHRSSQRARFLQILGKCFSFLLKTKQAHTAEKGKHYYVATLPRATMRFVNLSPNLIAKLSQRSCWLR